MLKSFIQIQNERWWDSDPGYCCFCSLLKAKVCVPQVELLTSLKSLHKHVEVPQLPTEFDGTFPFSHNSWICFRTVRFCCLERFYWHGRAYHVQYRQNIEKIAIKRHHSCFLQSLSNDRDAPLFLSEGWAVDQSLWGRNKSSPKHYPQPGVYSSASYCRGTVHPSQCFYLSRLVCDTCFLWGGRLTV